MKLYIIVRFQFEGFHQWREAPERHAYLRHPHRHMFHVEARQQVQHANRDVEFIELRRNMLFYCEKRYGAEGLEVPINPESCEQIALDLINRFKLTSCEVSEDGENGAEVSVD